MELINTILDGCFILKPTVFEDARGYFFESFNEAKFNSLTGLNTHFVQDNQSFSSFGVLRGLHFQKGDYAQAKLVRVLKGEVLDVVVDLRVDSPTYGKHVSVILTDENKMQLFVPRGFAHGFVVLSKKAVFFYKCDNYYHKKSEGGIIYNDNDLAINWKVSSSDLIVSEKDILLPSFENYNKKSAHV